MIPIVGKTNPDGLQMTRGRVVNYYVEVVDGNPMLLPTPVREKWTSLGNGPIRGWVEMGDHLYVVSGPTLHKISKSGFVEPIGSVATSSGRVPMTANGFVVMLADNGKLYATESDKLKPVTDPDAPQNVIDVTFSDGYFLVVDGVDDRFYITENTYDPFNWNALDFAASEFQPDRLKRIFPNKSILWAFDERSITPFTNTGNIDFPYEPIRSAVSHYGIEAEDSLCRVGGSVMWLGRNEQGGRVIYALQAGADPVPVSDSAINKFLASLDSVEGAIGYSMTYRGHDWYCLNLPYRTHGITLVFDQTVGACFEWSTFCESMDGRGRFRADRHVYFNGKHYVSDGADIHELVAPPIHTNMELRVSKNGKHWGYSRSKSLGTLGQYKRPIWRRLGDGRRWSFWLTSSSDAVCDGDQRVRRERILDAISQDDRSIHFNEFYLDVESGQAEQVIRGGNLR